MKRLLFSAVLCTGALAAAAACSSSSQSGAGGQTDGGAGTSGSAGTAGVGGAAGSVAGTGGSAGGSAGTAGVGGAAGSVAGTGGSAGGSAGTAGVGGAAGSAGGSAGAGGQIDGGTGGSGGNASVHGKVVDRLLQPVSGLPVVVGSNAVVTGEDGTFVLDAVANTYNAMVVLGDQYSVVVFNDLTRRDPTLQLYGYMPTQQTLELHGDITGNNIPNPSGSAVTTVFGSPTGACAQSVWTDVGDPSYSSAIPLHGGTSVDGKVYAMQWTVDSSSDHLPVFYTGYGHAPVSSGDSGGALTQNVALTALGPGHTQDFAGSITGPAGYTTGERYVGVAFDDYTVMHAVMDNSAAPETGPFSYKTPNISGAHATFMVDSGTSDEEIVVLIPGLALNATNVNVTLPNAPVLALPVDSAQGVTTSATFLWSEMDGAIYVATFMPDYGGPTVYLITSHPSVKLPDLTSIGLAWPKNARYYWWVTSLGPFSSTDAASGADGYFAAFNYTDNVWGAPTPIPPFPPLKTETTIGWSNERSFITAK